MYKQPFNAKVKTDWIIRICDIPKGETCKTLTWDAKQVKVLLDNPIEINDICSPLILSFSMQDIDGKIIIKGNLRVQIKLACVKCLKNFKRNIDADYRYVYEQNKITFSEEPLELNIDDMDTVFHDGSEIDLKLLVLEQIFLNIPAYPLCTDGCKGICPECGADLNRGKCTCVDKGEKAGSPFMILTKLKK